MKLAECDLASLLVCLGRLDWRHLVPRPFRWRAKRGSMQPLTASAVFALLMAGQPQGQGQQPDYASRIFEQYSKSVLVLVIRSDSGEAVGSATGFVAPGGKVVTNEHVTRAGHVFIDLGTAKVRTRVDRVDVSNDLALLSADIELSARPHRASPSVPGGEAEGAGPLGRDGRPAGPVLPRGSVSTPRKRARSR
jgi:hypothetical protein